MFQFTHPGKGATDAHLWALTPEAVSIHAPWEGCDCVNRTLSRSVCGFNSRTLGRVRPEAGRFAFLASAFQFTHPGKGATLKALPLLPLLV